MSRVWRWTRGPVDALLGALVGISSVGAQRPAVTLPQLPTLTYTYDSPHVPAVQPHTHYDRGPPLAAVDAHPQISDDLGWVSASARPEGTCTCTCTAYGCEGLARFSCTDTASTRTTQATVVWFGRSAGCSFALSASSSCRKGRKNLPRFCGHVGCCDSSVGRHAARHFDAEEQPVIRSFETGEAWRWCFADEVLG